VRARRAGRPPAATWALVALALSACGGAAPAEFARPSAALYDPGADAYLVSNLGREPGGGAVHVVSPADGAVYGLVTTDAGLRAPRGLALVGDTLWVADVDVLRAFDRATGAPRGVTPIPGASTLWGLTAGADGTVYVSDAGLDAAAAPTGTDAIWKVPPGGAPSVLVRGPELGGPTSLSAQRGGLYVVGGRDGSFYQVDYRGVRTELGRAPSAGLCGLVRVPGAPGAGDRRGRAPAWYASSRDGAAVYRFALTGGVEALPTRLESPGDLGYDARRGRLLVPLLGVDRLHVEAL